MLIVRAFGHWWTSAYTKALLSREANALDAPGRKIPRVGHVPSTDTWTATVKEESSEI